MIQGRNLLLPDKTRMVDIELACPIWIYGNTEADATQNSFSGVITLEFGANFAGGYKILLRNLFFLHCEYQTVIRAYTVRFCSELAKKRLPKLFSCKRAVRE